MKGAHIWTILIVAFVVHVALINFFPRVVMNALIERAGVANHWRAPERVTPQSRAIVRPSPDFAYFACPYDLDDGPVTVDVAPWDAYWSLSLYGANSDNYFTLNDREARDGAEIVLMRAGRAPPDTSARVVESPSARGIALVRRLAPDVDSFNAAVNVAHEDVCARFEAP